MFQQIPAYDFPCCPMGRVRYDELLKENTQGGARFCVRRASSQYKTNALSHMFRICAILLTFWGPFGLSFFLDCHSERSEESARGRQRILRCAQNDRAVMVLARSLQHLVNSNAIMSINDAQNASHHAIKFVQAGCRLSRVSLALRLAHIYITHGIMTQQLASLIGVRDRAAAYRDCAKWHSGRRYRPRADSSLRSE